MKPLNDAVVRNGTYYLHIRIPKDLVAEFSGKRFITESLRTKNRDEARELLSDRAKHVRADFKRRLAALNGPETETLAVVSSQSFADIGRSYGREIAERELTARADLYEEAATDSKAFFRSLPREEYEFTYLDKLVADGDLDRIVSHLVRERLNARIAELKRMVDTGNLGEMLELADSRWPGLERQPKVGLALTLARAEIAALRDVLSGDLANQEQSQTTSEASGLNSPSTSSALPPVSLDALFDKWAAETKPSASTRSTWTGHIKALKLAYPAKVDDVGSITTEDIIAFKDTLVAKGLAAKSINDSYLACLRTVFNYGLNNRLVPSNPAGGVKVSGSRKAGTGKLPYTNSEVARLLKLARAETNSARRWLPWLAAQTGSRIGEVAQLWGSFVKQEGGIWYLDIRVAPDAASIKEEVSERQVPVHPTLIEDGFLDFVKSRGDGPLFYSRSSGDPTKKHASKGVTNHVGTWIRSNGFTDPRKAPSHAIRHWFKTEAGRVGIDSRLIDKMQGHAPRSQGDAYYHPDLQTKLDALSKIVLPPTTGEA